MGADSAEQLGGLGVVERRDIHLEELDGLLEVIHEPPTTDNEDFGNPVTSFLETFMTPAQMDAFEKAKEGSIVPMSKEDTLWPRFRAGILWHPSIIGKLAMLSGVEAFDEESEDAWKDEASCKEDIRFVSAGNYRSIAETRELMDICEGCPVRANCQEHVFSNVLQYGFWAGVSRSKGSGYHQETGQPITLEEKRQMIDDRYGKA